MPVEIVVDAMGSDKAPESEIRGAILACRSLDVKVALVGPEERLGPALAAALRAPSGLSLQAATPRIRIVHCFRVDHHAGQGRAGGAVQA